MRARTIHRGWPWGAIGDLLRARPGDVEAGLRGAPVGSLGLHITWILLGAGLYGAVMGWWRSPVMAGYNAIKFPLIILATTLGNALLNGMLAPLLGANLRFRDSLRLVLMSCGMACVILAGMAPLVAFAVWNTPPFVEGSTTQVPAYRAVQLLQVAAVAFAGIAANVRLFQAIQALAQSATVARRVLFAWLAGNLLFGSQLCWILRPLIGNPSLPVEFLRPDAFAGNFFETLLRALRDLIST